jgi:hypothetical protein
MEPDAKKQKRDDPHSLPNTPSLLSNPALISKRMSLLQQTQTKDDQCDDENCTDVEKGGTSATLDYASYKALESVSYTLRES